ncbi:hypothetical protein PENSPDRAFT_313011 [Peniophora sp. CONT]|nr:hypothetical protein PENSPDRAFT_313011 [Peniophora sp. CONT]
MMREARENPRARTTSTTTNTSSAVLDLDWSLVGPASGSEQPPNLPRRHRASLLGAASGALAGRLSRRKARANTRPPSPTKEVAVRAADAEEAEERNRLRDAAAQSLGLELGLPVPGRLSSEKEHEGEEGDDEQGTEVRIQAPVTPTLPAFPATKASLVPLIVMQTALPKHYPPPSLFKRALAHQWKTRAVVLTGPPTTSRTGGGAPSHLHVFRIGSGSERELERLAIDERSVVFVADEDVSGRAHVVKVGGHDVGARRRELNGEESGMTMMWLQIVDAQESRAWIGAIKAAVLGQRSVRAGLGNSYGASPSEPRGDLDVVLSMRMQGMGARPAPSESSQSQTSSTSSTRPNSPRPTISFKGLFGNSRPRSLSRATSIASTDDSHPVSPTADSFASVANSIMAHETPYARRIVHNRTSVDLDYEDALSTRAMSPPPLGPPPNRRRTHTSTPSATLARSHLWKTRPASHLSFTHHPHRFRNHRQSLISSALTLSLQSAHWAVLLTDGGGRASPRSPHSVQSLLLPRSGTHTRLLMVSHNSSPKCQCVRLVAPARVRRATARYRVSSPSNVPQSRVLQARPYRTSPLRSRTLSTLIHTSRQHQDPVPVHTRILTPAQAAFFLQQAPRATVRACLRLSVPHRTPPFRQRLQIRLDLSFAHAACLLVPVPHLAPCLRVALSH